MVTSDTSISSANGEPVGPFVNRRLRSVKWPGLLGARISAGTIRREAGVGDTVIADFQRGFFAIADSSDRNPVFGRQFLHHFSAFIAGLTRFGSSIIHANETIEPLLRSITLESRAMLRTLPFHGSCAFTGLCLTRTGQGLAAFLIHTGDTALFTMDADRAMSLLTKKNFWFVGKSTAFSHIEYMWIEPGMRFLFSTDGLLGLSPLSGMDLASTSKEILESRPIEDVPDAIFDAFGTRPSGADDSAVMSLDLARLDQVSVSQPIVLGGTSAEEERERRLRPKGTAKGYVPWDEEAWDSFPL